MVAKKDIGAFAEPGRVLLRTKDFICLRPHPGLRGRIANYSVTCPNRLILPEGFTEMPCGCATLEIGRSGTGFLAELYGPTTRPHVVGGLAGRFEMLVSIEFKPAGMYALTGMGQSELADERVDLMAADPKLGRAFCEVVEGAKSIEGLVAGLDCLLLAAMNTVYRPELVMALQSITALGGNVSVKGLAHDLHYSERQLNRIFNQQVGMGAKAYSRLVRVGNTFRLVKQGKYSLRLVSDRMGFHDLSHFTRDFKSVCGVTPQEYRENMAVFYTNMGKL